MYKYRRRKRLIAIVGALVGLAVFIRVILWMVPNGDDKAAEAVATFYRYEQEGNFSESWEMFHPLMRERFSKGHYIQDRAHVFMNHFGVETFDYVLGDAEKIENWKITEDAKPLEIAYKVPVTLTYKGKYGNFSINQDVYTVEDEKEWKILWNYYK